MIDVTITIAGLHDLAMRAIFWSFLGVIVNVCRVLGSKANNGLLGFDLSLIGEWILFEEISVVVRVKDNYYYMYISKLDRFPYLVFEHNTVVIYFYPRDLGSVQSGCVVFLFESSNFDRLNY